MRNLSIIYLCCLDVYFLWSDFITFTFQQEVSPEADDRHLSVQSVLLPGEIDGEEPIDRLSHERSCCFAENTAEHRWEELHLDRKKGLDL